MHSVRVSVDLSDLRARPATSCRLKSSVDRHRRRDEINSAIKRHPIENEWEQNFWVSFAHRLSCLFLNLHSIHTFCFNFPTSKPAMECSPAMLRFFERTRGVTTMEALKKGLDFHPWPSDVLLTTGLKCGTTWMQQIMHGLRSGGDMSFEEIDTVFPSLELYYGYQPDGDLAFEQPFSPPRFFRTHHPFGMTPQGFGKYIVVTRSILHLDDASITSLRCLETPKTPSPLPTISSATGCLMTARYLWMSWPTGSSFGTTSPTLPSPTPINCNTCVGQRRRLCQSDVSGLVSWYPYRNDSNVLWLHYEDLKEDLSGCICRVAKFLGLGENNPKLLKLVEHQVSIPHTFAHTLSPALFSGVAGVYEETHKQVRRTSNQIC